MKYKGNSVGNFQEVFLKGKGIFAPFFPVGWKLNLILTCMLFIRKTGLEQGKVQEGWKKRSTGGGKTN